MADGISDRLPAGDRRNLSVGAEFFLLLRLFGPHISFQNEISGYKQKRAFSVFPAAKNGNGCLSCAAFRRRRSGNWDRLSVGLERYVGRGGINDFFTSIWLERDDIVFGKRFAANSAARAGIFVAVGLVLPAFGAQKAADPVGSCHNGVFP